MSEARDEILSRLRAVRDQRPVPVPRDYLTASAASGADPVALLVDRLVDYRATVRRCGRAELAPVLATVLADVPRIAAPADLPTGWLTDYTGEVRRDDAPVPLTVTELDRPGLAVVTGCAVAVGQTGTVILDAGPTQGPRRLTLVPDHHVCVVGADQVVTGLPEALARITDPTRPLTLISGPSATSDIELNRVEGVHGPRRLDVIIVESA
ncbi:LUD domain-containing protein [Solwaraspora sp. WMMD406]|uniref:LutC/YkgG family protein n=1 Tax=Solwaraspora sp. WMMD406 TaxID=3016095 RepID=UPI002417B10F|nr:LUD domain-containing protein [Solwaraspora sp. WMMD406]MDG4767404.1 LUD domain-containing protein [Solwaraspora sp. WMMD406]